LFTTTHEPRTRLAQALRVGCEMATPDAEMDDLDDTSTTSSLGELATCVQNEFEQVIAYSDTTPEGAYIIEREAMANVLHSLTDLFEAIDDREGDKTPSPRPSQASFKQVLDRLSAIEKQIQRIQTVRAPKASRRPSWAEIAANPPTPSIAIPRGRAVTVRPPTGKYKDKEPQEILRDLKADIPGAVGVRPLRSGDIRVVLRDTKAKEQAMRKGSAGDVQVLRQDYPVEVAGVPLTIPITHGREGDARNAPLIHELHKDNKHIQGNLITRVAWIHGNRSQTAGRARSSLIVYFATEEARDRVVRDGLTVRGLWYYTKLWAQALHSPRCFKCNRWGHTQTACASQARCGHCAGPHNTKDCTQIKKTSCANCGRRHKAWSRRDCPVYKTAREEAARLRYSLLMETARIRTERNHTKEPQAHRDIPASLPLKRGVGRPTNLSKAGPAAGQRVLQWQATVEHVEDTMEE
jgi:hypothetical protein